jgi:hypothetical protein
VFCYGWLDWWCFMTNPTAKRDPVERLREAVCEICDGDEVVAGIDAIGNVLDEKPCPVCEARREQRGLEIIVRQTEAERDDAVRERDALREAAWAALNTFTLPSVEHNALDDAVGLCDTPAQPTDAPCSIYVVFDGPPSHESGRFVEVETADGRGLSPRQTGADWHQREDGLWALGPFAIAQPTDAPTTHLTCSRCGGPMYHPQAIGCPKCDAQPTDASPPPDNCETCGDVGQACRSCGSSFCLDGCMDGLMVPCPDCTPPADAATEALCGGCGNYYLTEGVFCPKCGPADAATDTQTLSHNATHSDTPCERCVTLAHGMALWQARCDAVERALPPPQFFLTQAEACQHYNDTMDRIRKALRGEVDGD